VTKENFNKLEAWSVYQPDPTTGIPTEIQNWTPPVAPDQRKPLDLSDAWVYSDTKIGYKKLSPPSQK
jgi:hypothetical protein